MEKFPDDAKNLEQLTAALTPIAEHYYTDWAYHNFEHAQTVLANALELADYCETNDLEVDRKILIGSILLHDANYHVSDEEHGYRSKEEYSAQIAGEILPTLGFTDEETEHAMDCIRSTERGVTCQTLEARIVRRADLANLAGDFWGFLVSSKRLWEEAGKPVRIDEWLSNAQAIRDGLDAYFSEDVSFGEFDRTHGMSVFLYNALSNLDMLDNINKHVKNASNFWNDTFTAGKSFIDQVISKLKG